MLALMSVIMLFFLIAAAIQTPWAQNIIIEYISEAVSDKTGFEITIEKTGINWFDEATIEGVQIKDLYDSVMLRSDKINTDLHLWDFITEGHLHFEVLTVSHPYINVLHNKSDSVYRLNLKIFLQRLAGNKNKKRKTKLTPDIILGKILLTDGEFLYTNVFSAVGNAKFDVNHLHFANINLEAEEIVLINDTLSLDLNNLTALETNSGIEIKKLSTAYQMSAGQMKFMDLKMHFNESEVYDSLVLDYDRPENLAWFRDSVRIYANLNKASFSANDLELFVPGLKNIPKRVLVSGIFQGRYSNFRFSDYFLEFGANTKIRGNAQVSGLPDAENTFLNIEVVNSDLLVSDLASYLHNDLKNTLKNTRKLSFNGQLLGYPSDFVAYGELRTDFGNIESDVNLKMTQDQLRAHYSGRVSMDNFDLGGFLGNQMFQKLSFRGSVNGAGMDIKNADIHINGEIDRLGISGYNYTGIFADARLSHQLFEGELRIDDPNLKFKMDGSVDLRPDHRSINITSVLDTLDLYNLGLTKTKSRMRVAADLKFTGLTFDSISGNAYFSDLLYINEEDSLSIDTIYFSSVRDKTRKIDMTSSIMDLHIEGLFGYNQTIKAFNQLRSDYQIILENDSASISSLLTEMENRPVQEFDIQYNILLKDTEEAFRFINKDLYISNNTVIEGNYTNGRTSIINLSAAPDSVRIKDAWFIDNTLEFSASKLFDTTNVLAMVYVHSSKQDFGHTSAEGLLFEGAWNNRRMDYEASLAQEKFNNRITLFGGLDLFDGYTKIKIDSSDIKMLNEPWKVNPENYIHVNKKEALVHNLMAQHNDQSLGINGEISSDPQKVLNVFFNNLNINNISSFFNKDLTGTLDGSIDFSDVYNNTKVENDLKIKDFAINAFPVGDVQGRIKWNKEEKLFNLGFSIKENDQITMLLEGMYHPEKEEPIDINAELINTNINILEPFIGAYFSQIQGQATGKFKISGTVLSPKVVGEGTVNKGKATINYLNTTYQFNGGFGFSENSIALKKLQISDIYGNNGQLSGEMYHSGFKTMRFDLIGGFEKLHVLNTTPKDNSLFYGQGFGTGTIEIGGTTSNLLINSDVRSEKGTRIYIPIGGLEYAETKDFISFTSFSDTLSHKDDHKKGQSLTGVVLDLNLDITTDTYCEIIFDIKAGDIIRGRGNGNINLLIDSNGEFSMYGPLTIQQGWYNFTLYNLINKEFNILPGGKITWFGDPYGGVLDLKASYNQNTSLKPLITNVSLLEAEELKRGYETMVMMGLTGPLLSPEIKFNIDVPELPRSMTVEGRSAGTTLEYEFESFINSIDEQELKRQVFSLIVLKRFSPPEAFFNAEGAISNSVSELLSNQLSYFISQVDENLEVDLDVDLSKFDPEAFNTFQLRLSYTFMDGRLRISRDGAFMDYQNQVNVNSLAGDWTVEYLLTENGKMKVKMYNRTNYNNAYLTPERNNATTAGFSIQYTQSFNDFLKEMTKIFRSSQPEERGPKNQDESLNNEGIRDNEEEF